jgi:hypothetical protein
MDALKFHPTTLGDTKKFAAVDLRTFGHRIRSLSRMLNLNSMRANDILKTSKANRKVIAIPYNAILGHESVHGIAPKSV